MWEKKRKKNQENIKIIESLQIQISNEENIHIFKNNHKRNDFLIGGISYSIYLKLKRI